MLPEHEGGLCLYPGYYRPVQRAPLGGFPGEPSFSCPSVPTHLLVSGCLGGWGSSHLLPPGCDPLERLLKVQMEAPQRRPVLGDLCDQLSLNSSMAGHKGQVYASQNPWHQVPSKGQCPFLKVQ